MILDIWYLIFIGGLGGVVSVFLGLGGGILFVTLLPMFAEISHRETVATSLLTTFLIVSLNSYFFARQSLVKWKVVFTIVPSAAIGSYTAATLSHFIGERHLQFIFVGVIFLLALRTFLNVPGAKKNIRWPLASLVGVSVGGASGLAGIGAGVILSPVLLNWGGVKGYEVSPTSNAVMVFTTLFATLVFFELPHDNMARFGLIHMDKVLVLFVAASVCAHFGRSYQVKVRDQWRKWALSLVLFLVAARILIPLMSRVCS